MGPLDPLKKADSGAARPAGKGLAKPPVKTKGTGVQAPPKANKPAPGQKANASRQNQILSSPFSKYKGILFSVAFPYAGVDREYQQTVFTLLEQNLNNPGFIITDQYINGEKMFEKHQLVNVYQHMLETLGIKVEAGKKGLIGKGMSKGIQDFKILLLAQGKNLPENESIDNGNFSPAIQKLLIAEYANLVGSVKKWVGEFAPQKDRAELVKTVLELLSGKKGKMFLFDLGEIGTKIRKITIATTTDGKVKKSEKKSSPLYDLIKFYLARKYRLDQKKRENAMEILNKFSLFQKEKGIVKGEEAKQREKIYQVGKYLRGEMGKRRGRKQKPVPPYLLSAGRRIVNNARAKGYTSVILGLSKKQQLAPGEIPLGRQMIYGELVRMIQKNIKGMNRRMVIKAIGVAYTLIKFKLTYSELILLDKVYSSLGDLNGTPLILTAETVKEMVQDYSGRKIAWKPKLETQAVFEAAEEVEVDKYIKIPDLSRICALKSVIYNRGYKASPNIETLDSHNIRAIVDVFSSGGWMINTIFRGEQLKAMEAAEKWKELDDDSKTLLKKIVKMQYGVSSLYISAKDLRKIKKLIQKLKGIEKAGGANMFEATVIMEALKELEKPGNLLRLKVGLSHKEVRILHAFADALKSGKFIKVENRNGDLAVKAGKLVSLVDPAKGNTNILFKEGLEVLNKLGWQLSEIMPQMEEKNGDKQSGGFLAFIHGSVEDFKEGLGQVSAKQMVKVSGVEDHVIMTFRALTYGKNQAIFKQLKALYSKLKANKKELKELKKKHGKLKGDGELLKKNPVDYDKYKALLLEARSIALQMNKLARKVFSSRVDLPFLRGQESVLKRACKLINLDNPILEGYLLTDQTGKAIKIPDVYKFIYDTLKADGGRWETSTIIPGEPRNTTMAKKLLALAVYNTSLFQKCVIHKGAALLGGLPVAGMIPNLALKGTSGVLLNTEASYEFGVQSDDQLLSYLPHDSKGRFLFKARMFASNFIEIPTNQKANMSPYLYLLLSSDAEDRIEMLMNVFAGGKKLDVINNIGTIDAKSVRLARTYFEKLERRTNELLKGSPKLYKKLKDDISKDPMMKALVEFDDKNNSFKFKKTEALDKLEAFAKLIKDKRVVLYHNSQQMEQGLRDGAAVLNSLINIAFKTMGCCGEKSKIFSRPAEGLVSSQDVTEGWKRAQKDVPAEQKGKILRSVGQEEGLSVKLWDTGAHILTNPVSSTKEAFRASLETGVFFALMPAVFSYQFSQWAGRLIDAVSLLSSNPALARKKFDELLTEIQKLAGAVTGFSFNPLAFWYMVKEAIDAKQYGRAMGIAVAVARFAIYVAKRDYYLVTNGLRWVAGKPTIPMGWSLLNIHVRGLVWGVKQGAEQTLGRLWGHESRYEAIGRPWDRTISPWLTGKKQWAKNNTMGALKWLFKENSVFKGIGAFFSESYSNSGPVAKFLLGRVAAPMLGISVRGLETLGDAYWNGILAHRWSNKVWGGLSYVSRGFSDWAIFAPGRHADWESRMADLNKKVDDASRKVGVVDIYRTNRAGGDRTKAYRRSGPQAEMLVESGALYGVKLSSFEGDPRNAIFKSKLAKALESLGKGRPKINGIPIERIQIVKGKQIGYLTLNFEGNKGIELRIGQELLTESPETIAKYIEGLSKLDKNVGRSRVVEAERTKGKKGDVKKPSEVEVRPGESVASTAKIIDGLIPEMGKLTYEELTGLTKKVKAEFSRALAGRKITDLSNEELVELMDTTKIEFNGKKYTLLELRLAQAREIVKRYTTREFKNESYLPRKVFDAARKSVRKSGSWKKFTMAEGKILTTVQIQAILSMHKGLGAQFLMGQGKTNVIGALQIVNSVLGRQMYSTSHSNLDSKASYYEQRLFLKAAGIKTGFVDYHNSNFDAVRQTFQKNELVYLSQSDLTFIHLINRTIPEGWQRVPIDFKKGIFAVDEYDFILVDQGQTPHIISDMNSAEVEDSRAWRNASKAVGSLKEGVHYQRSAKGEFEILEKDKRVFRSERGFARKWDDLSEKQRHRITKCLEARYLVPGKDYVISHVRGMIVIIDKNTGQLSRGTEWSDGLHQAVQAKHLSTQYGKITSPMQTLESITASEFGKLMRWKVGCSGTLIQIAELLGREGIGIVDIPSVVPPLDIDAEVAKRRTVEQITKTALDIVARTSLEVTFSYDIQLEFSPKNRAVAEAVMDALRLKNNSKGDAISPSWKNRHNERVYRNWVTQRDAMVADIETETENAKTTHTSKKARAIVIVIEDPLKAKNLFEQLSSKLKGSKLTFLDHSDEVRYQQVFGRELQRGEVIVTTLARRGTDPQPADKEGLILYIGDRAENSWGQLQKEGRWPRVGKNGELRLFSSLDEGVYHSEVGIDKAVELIDKTGLSEILRNSLKARLVNLKAGNVSYADLLALSGQGDAFKLAAFEGEITFEDAVKLLGEAKSLDPALQMGLIKKLLAIKMGNMSYSDLIQIVMQKNNNHATDIENIINAAQGDSDEKTFDREFKMRKLSTIKENADALLDKLRDRYQVAGSRGIIEDVIRRQVEALAEKHGIKDGGKWDIKGFNESIKELFGLKEVDITIEARPGERARVNAKGFIDAVRAKLVKRYLSEKSQGRMGIDSHQEKMMKYFLFQNFKDAEMGLRRAWERLTRKLDTVLEGAMAKVVDGEVVLKMTGEQKTAFELLQKEYNDAVKDILMLSERKAISEVVKRTRSNWLVKWATKGRGYNRPDGKLRIRILATVSAPSGAPEAPRSEGPRPRPLRAPSGPTSNPALQLNESQYKELAKDGITQNDRQLIVRGEEGKYYEVTLGKGVRYSKGLDGKFYISRGGGQTGFNGVSELISAINSGRGLGAQISSVDISRPTAVLKKHGLNAFDGMMIPFEMIKKVVPLEDVLFIPETLAPGVKRTSDGTIKIDGAKVKDFHQALKLANDAIHVVYEGAEKIKVRFYRGEIKTFTEARALLESIYSWSGAADIEGKGIKQERKTEVDEALSSKTLKRLSRRSIFHRGGAGASEVITFSTGQKATITVSAKNTVTIRFHEDGQEVKVSRRELTILAKGERVWKNLLRRTSRMNKKYSPSDVTEGVYIALTENGNLADSQRYSNKVRVSLIRLEGVSDVKSAQELARMILLEAASEIGKVNKKLGEAFKTAIKGLSLPELSKLDPSEILTLASMLESRRHRIRFNSQTENWVRGILEKAGLPKAAVTETIARLRWERLGFRYGKGVVSALKAEISDVVLEGIKLHSLITKLDAYRAGSENARIWLVKNGILDSAGQLKPALEKSYEGYKKGLRDQLSKIRERLSSGKPIWKETRTDLKRRLKALRRHLGAAEVNPVIEELDKLASKDKVARGEVSGSESLRESKAGKRYTRRVMELAKAYGIKGVDSPEKVQELITKFEKLAGQTLTAQQMKMLMDKLAERIKFFSTTEGEAWLMKHPEAKEFLGSIENLQKMALALENKKVMNRAELMGVLTGVLTILFAEVVADMLHLDEGMIRFVGVLSLAHCSMKGLSPLFTSKTRQDAWKNLRKSLNALKNKPGMTSQKAFKAVFSARGFNYLANETAGMIKGVSHAVVFGMVYDSALAMAGIKPAEGKLGFLRNHTISLIATIIGMGAINKWFVKPRLIAGPNGTKVLPKGMARAGAALGVIGAAVVVEGMVFQNFLKPSTQSAVAEVQQALGKKSWGFLFDNGTFIGRVNTAIYYGDKVKVRALEVQKEAREAQKDLGKYFVLREKGGLRKDSSYYSNISADHADIKHVNKYFSRPVFLSEEMQKIAYEYAQAKTRRSWLLQEVPELKGKINLIFTNTYNKREDIVFKKNAEELIKKYIKDPQKQKFMLELAKKKPRSIQDIDGAARICLRDKESFTDKSTIGEKINRKNGASYYQYVELKKLNGSTDLNILDIFGVFLMQQSMANRVAVYKEMGEKAFLSHFRVIKGQEYPGVSPHKQAVVIRSPKRYLEYAARYSVTSDEKKMILAARRKHRMNQLINAAVQNKKVVYHLEEYTKILPDIQAGFLKQIYVDLPTGGKSAAYTINEDNATYIAIMTRKYKGMRQIYMMAKREAEKKGAKLDTMIQFLALENKLKSMVIDLWKVAMNGGEDSKRYIALLMGVERSQIDAKLAQIGLNKEFLVKLRSVESKPKKKTRDFLMHMAMVNLIKRKIVLG